MTKMNALVLHGIGDLRYQQQATPEPKAGEARVCVRVTAGGIKCVRMWTRCVQKKQVQKFIFYSIIYSWNQYVWVT